MIKIDVNADLDQVNSIAADSDSFESCDFEDTPDRPQKAALLKSEQQNAEKATKDQLELLILLKKSYVNTTRELLRLCIAHD